MTDLPTPPGEFPALSGPQRLKAALNMWFVDHGFIRDVYWNLHRLSERAWRAAQPGPRQLRKAKALGVRTVLNLRGRRETCGAYLLERETCRTLGLDLVDFPIRSRSALEPETLLAAADLFPRLDYPVLMHCKSGADRAGFMAALYMHLHEGRPIEEAARQLSLRYGHVSGAKTGVLDYFFRRYREDTAARPMTFTEWVRSAYDPAELDASFRANRLAGVLVDRILRRE